MSVDRGEVERIAQLARLSLSDEELDTFTDQLNGILGHMDALATLEREAGVDDAAGPTEERGTPLRPEDRSPDALARPPAELAPDWRDGFFAVPRLAAQERLAEGGDASELEEDGDA